MASRCRGAERRIAEALSRARTQVTVAILLNSFVGAINDTEEEETRAATAGMKSKEMLRSEASACWLLQLACVRESEVGTGPDGVLGERGMGGMGLKTTHI